MAFSLVSRLGLVLCLIVSASLHAQGVDEPPEWRMQRRLPRADRAPNSTENEGARSRLDVGRRGKKGFSRRGASEIEYEGFVGLGAAGVYSATFESILKVFSLRTQFPIEPGIALGANFDFMPAIAIDGADTTASWGFSVSFNYYFLKKTLLGPWLQLGAGFLKRSSELTDGTKISTTSGVGISTIGWRIEIIPEVNLGISGGAFTTLDSGGAIAVSPTGALEVGASF